jgi:hypothetical protein
LAAVFGAVVRSSTAQAGLCVPQTEFVCAGLQSHLNALGQSIDVLAQQQEGLVWGTNASLNATMTIMFQLAGNPNQDEFGIVGIDSRGGLTGLCAVFPSDDFNTGYFAVASFRAGNTLTVNLFNTGASFEAWALWVDLAGARQERPGHVLQSQATTSMAKVHSLYSPAPIWKSGTGGWPGRFHEPDPGGRLRRWAGVLRR